MELTTSWSWLSLYIMLFMMSKIRNLNGTHNQGKIIEVIRWLFVMSKIQNLNGTHNPSSNSCFFLLVVCDVKDTKFEWNSQQV